MLNTKIAVAYRAHLNASAALQALITPLLRGGHLSNALVSDFALEHAHFYQCCYEIKASGAVRFYVAGQPMTSANVQHAAQKAWQRGIAQFVRKTEARGGARERNRTSVAEKFLAQFHKLEAKDRREVLRLLKGEGLI